MSELWTEARLVDALGSRYGEQEWAVLTQVRDGSGWDRRTFDALAINLWGSRGHVVHGFECKVSKSDWKRELKAPEKADPLVRFCAYWWVVAPLGIVDPMTLPVGWGLLEARDNGTIHTVAEATRREPEPFTPGFVAQVLKRARRTDPYDAAVAAALAEGYREGIAAGKAEQERAAARLAATEARLKAIEEATGLRLDYADMEKLRQYGTIIRNVAESRGLVWTDGPFSRLRRAREAAEAFVLASAEVEQP